MPSVWWSPSNYEPYVRRSGRTQIISKAASKTRIQGNQAFKIAKRVLSIINYDS